MSAEVVQPSKISLTDLQPAEQTEFSGDQKEAELDLGNLCVFVPKAVDRDVLTGDGEKEIVDLAKEAACVLFSSLRKLPRPRGPDVISLPTPTTQFPREKPLPTPKPLTKWETYAKAKGIKKRKKEKKVWDEARGEWRRRYGYKKANDSKDIAIIEAKPTDKPGESPFAKMEEEKKERVRKQKGREVRNIERAVRDGHRLPSSVKLVANLPKKGKGHPLDRRKMKEELGQASNMAGMSTASLGKFDRRLKGENPDDRTSKKKKRNLISNHDGGEKEFLDSMAQKLVRMKSEKVLDVDKAVGKLEAEKRRQRHEERVQEAMQSGKRPRSKKDQAKKDVLPKLKVTTRQKNIKRRRK